MLKKIIAAAMLLSLLCACSAQQPQQQPEEQAGNYEQSADYIEAVWLTCYELSPMFEGGEKAFTEKAQQVIKTCEKNNINTLFLQVRPFCDSFYPSKLFPWSVYALDSAGKPPEFDPLKIFTDLSHKASIKIHAWINPYRISYDENYEIDDRFSSFAVRCKEGVFLNPAEINSQKTVLDGVREILENYDVDGIHIDDYFYPTQAKSFDAEQYADYKKSGGSLGLTAWRQGNVNALVSALYSLVHLLKPGAVFSISPAADIEKNKNVHYADVELWFTQPGYADWIVPQLYFGFEHETKPFSGVAAEWEKLAENSSVKLVCGVAAYKSGTIDSLAGTGENEWKENSDIIQRQIKYIFESKIWNGYSLFSYKSIPK